MPTFFSQDQTAAGVPRKTWGAPDIIWLALPMAFAIVGLLLLNNWQYIFHTELHENGDLASNSLFVREAKHGVLLHGHYSRFNFYHPGPALFFVLAGGEALFFNLLHVVPTPYNGQTIALCVVMTLFFSLSLSIFAQGLGKQRGGHTFFLPLAVLFAVWHYGAASGGLVFMDSWPVNPVILVFLCFLVSCASVASGAGKQLPLLAITAGWLVHNYIAQPLFVVPMTLLAYAGLIASCLRQGGTPDESIGRKAGNLLSAGWRAFPRAHVAAGLFLGLFILPLLLDALHGSDSNLGRILAHLREPHEPPKKLMRSVCYFLTFGAYAPFDATKSFFDRYSAAGMLSFAALHWQAYLAWTAVLAAAPVLFITSRRSLAAPATPAADAAPAREASTFIPWFYVMLASALGLTLVWGMKQEGYMFYYNAFFNYSIYYGAALGLAAALAVFLHALTAAPANAAARAVICAALWLGLAAAVVDEMPRFRLISLDTAENRVAARSIERAAAATVPPGSLCFLSCDPWDAWPFATATALQLERLGCTVRVFDDWATMFGVKRTIGYDESNLSKPIVRWRIVPMAKDPVRLARWPLEAGYAIEVIPMADLNPAGGLIRFASDGNINDYAVCGWSPCNGDWTFSDQRAALLQFRPLPLPEGDAAGVELQIIAWTSPPPGETDLVRATVEFNGVKLDTLRLPLVGGGGQPLRLKISSALWKEAVAKNSGRLLFRFPDVRSPKSRGLSLENRLLGGCFRSIQFQPAAASAGAIAPPAEAAPAKADPAVSAAARP